MMKPNRKNIYVALAVAFIFTIGLFLYEGFYGYDLRHSYRVTNSITSLNTLELMLTGPPEAVYSKLHPYVGKSILYPGILSEFGGYPLLYGENEFYINYEIWYHVILFIYYFAISLFISFLLKTRHKKIWIGLLVAALILTWFALTVLMTMALDF